MRSTFQIIFDFEEAKRQAQKIDDVAERMEELANQKLGQARENLTAYWQGSSAGAFQERQNELQQGILGTAEALHQQADNIRMIAKRLYDAEMEALRIAEERSYGG
ncbi:hypothetical protein OBV_34240 [Oscillibacter valericigenes Sjm18-20]|nr:hypothetical protein OBV_34240 [Oscillibacter valericigenes Sjm18-20]